MKSKKKDKKLKGSYKGSSKSFNNETAKSTGNKEIVKYNEDLPPWGDCNDTCSKCNLLKYQEKLFQDLKSNNT